jgi:hypothetical protein
VRRSVHALDCGALALLNWGTQPGEVRGWKLQRTSRTLINNSKIIFIFFSPIACGIPDSPHEPDPEPYEPIPPKLIPLDEVSP